MNTKLILLDTAEILFADFGYPSTSLRDITARANVNLASVNYHFGTKLNLLRAVFVRRFEPVNRERLERLDAVKDGDVEEILRAFFLPLFTRFREPEPGWSTFMSLVGRTYSDTNEEIRNCLFEQVKDVGVRFSEVLENALPELPSNELSLRIHFVVGAMAHTFAFCRHRNVPLVRGLPDPEAILSNLVIFATAGLRASGNTLSGAKRTR